MFASRRGVPGAAFAWMTMFSPPAATGCHGPVGFSAHSRVIGSSPKFLSVAFHRRTRVSVPAGPDTGIVTAIASVADRLGTIADSIGGETPWAPDRYRAMLLGDTQVQAPSGAWPWPDLTPADFTVNPDPNAMQFPSRTMTAAEIEAVGFAPYTGGYTGFTLILEDGTAQSFAVRPLFPDEAR